MIDAGVRLVHSLLSSVRRIKTNDIKLALKMRGYDAEQRKQVMLKLLAECKEDNDGA